MTVADVVRDRNATLTPAERRVAELVVSRPQEVAFGTVASLASLTGTSGATVVRLAGKLGYEGFVGLQERVQAELAAQLGPAAERIRRPAPEDVVAQSLGADLENVEATMHAVDRDAFATAVGWLADPGRRVFLCAGDCARGVGLLAADQLLSLRRDVTLIDGNQVRVGRELALIEEGDVVVAIDFHRYDKWVLLAADLARDRHGRIVAITDSRLGPLARTADCTFVVSATGAGPFDSQVGTLSMTNALVAGVAAAVRDDAYGRLDRIERLWQRMGALTSES